MCYPLKNDFDFDSKVAVIHDPKRKILEIPSLMRVLNNYYFKKTDVQENLKPLLIKRFKEGLETVQKRDDWLFTVPTAIETLSEDFSSKSDSFRFPDSIVLFESWMNLGIDALYPYMAIHFKFPGLLKGEKTRNLFQFIYSTSRGFGFPIYFAPEFYGYKPPYKKFLDYLFEWSYSVCHKANQAIFLVDKKINSKRHHPGEFESVILSEYQNNVYKGINTLLHGYFTDEPTRLGKFSSLQEVLKNITFEYSVGDHAMSVSPKRSRYKKHIPLLTYDEIVEKYDVDFFSYLKMLMEVNDLLTEKIHFYKRKRKNLIKDLSLLEKIDFRFQQSKKISIPGQELPEKYSEIEKIHRYKHLLEKIRYLLWTTPLFSHTIHSPLRIRESYKFLDPKEKSDYLELESSDSILLIFISYYEKNYDFKFEEAEVVKAIKKLQDKMAKMWLYFKERQFKYATRKLKEVTQLSISDPEYNSKIKYYLFELIPIISIYEIFNRPLSESIYPESIPQTKRLGQYLVRFLASRYNILGVNLVNLFNRLAFKNWAYFIKRNELTLSNFFRFILKLPIWKHIPKNIKDFILKQNFPEKKEPIITKKIQ
ncbi:MAG: hypothetical protein BAJALOKI2v1_400018 [Promethearchaeota archaeon]|nr:MAG: hypothetical protein BAJALOKI2v1_400018 [Candidatus Lokiarchaeota archaeon]